MPCAFCGKEPIERAHIKDEHVLIKAGLNKQAAEQGNIIPLCKVHHRDYFDYLRDGVDENREWQFEPRLIIDFVNKELVLYNYLLDFGDNETLINSIEIIPIGKYVQFHYKEEYVKWKNKRMNDRLSLYLMKKSPGLLKTLKGN